MTRRMSGYVVLDILDNIAYMVSQRGLPPLVKQPAWSIREGRTITDKQKVIEFIIGTKELEENPDKMFDLGEAMIPIAGAFHEICGHGGQILNEFQKDTPLSRVLAVNYIACKSSPYYYNGFIEGSDRYKRQPHEIAAQYACIRELRPYLIYLNPCDYEQGKDVIGFADMAVREYQKTRMRRKSALTGKGKMAVCGDFDDILLDLNSRFYECAVHYHEYDALKKLEGPKCPDDVKHAIRQDAIFKYAVFQGEDPDKPESVARVVTRTSGTRQDKRLAFAYLQLEKDDYENHGERYEEVAGKPVGGLPVFSSGWLTYEHAFGKTPDPSEHDRDWLEVDRSAMVLRKMEPVLMDPVTNRPLRNGKEKDEPDGP